MATPELPLGFTLDEDIPPLPTGFTIDEAISDYEAAKTPIYPVGAPFPNPSGGEQPIVGYRPDPDKSPLPATSTNIGASIKAKLVEDPQTQRKLIAESLFPGDRNAINRVGLLDGRPVFVNDDGKLEYVSGDLANFGAAVVANAPEAIGATVGSFAASPVVGATLGAMGARGLKRAAAGAILDEPQTIKGNLADVAVEGALNFATGGLGKGAAKVADRGKIIDFTPTDIKTAEQAREYIKRTTGIDTDIAQASGNRKLLGLRDYAARYPGKSAEIIQAADDAAAGQFEQATERVLNLIAKAEPSEIAGMRGANAAQLAIKVAREKVYNEVRPLYDAAYAAKPEIKNPRALAMLKLPYFDKAFQAGQRIAKLEGTALKTGEKPDLRALDYTKRALDDQIEVLRDSGRRQEAAALTERKNEFVKFLDNVTDDKYQLARSRYAELIKTNVEPLENGAVGVLAKIQNPQAATAASKILADANITPAQINRTRVIIEQQDPEAWNGLVRQWMGQKWNVASKETQSGDVINPAGKFRQAVFGTPMDKAKAAAMLTPQSAQAFNDLMTAAEALAKTPLGASRIAGSNTARDLELNKSLESTGGVVFKWLTSPRKSIQDAAELRAKERNILAITEAITNPAKRSQLRQVARMQPSTRQVILLTNILGGQITQRAVASGATVQAPLSQPQGR